ncbi:MAG: 50S ribosomal protein L32 [Rickettsiaceae bacterium]|nr:50S ribosomal protein L32 [Rickettsiaceae bacterium]
MAVPKKKTSKSKRNMRRSHHSLPRINVIVDKETGEYRLPHTMNVLDGKYKGRQVLSLKLDTDEEDSEE